MNFDGKKILGIDEAGKGPLAGPVVIAGCVFKPEIDMDRLNKVRDSKKMTEKARNEAFEYIKENSFLSIAIINNKEIDKLGINKAIKKGVKQVYNKLKDKVDITIFDGSWDPVMEKGFYTLVGGDNKVKEISAASVVAKVVRDKIMCEDYAQKYPQYLFEKHKGYGTKEHRDLIKEHGRCEIHRTSFRIKGYDR